LLHGTLLATIKLINAADYELIVAKPCEHHDGLLPVVLQVGSACCSGSYFCRVLLAQSPLEFDAEYDKASAD